MNDEKTHAVINRRMFKKLGHIKDQLQEAQLAKPEFEHKRPMIVVFFILRYATLRLLELNYIFFTDCCDTDKCEEMEMDTDLLFLGVAENDLFVFITKREKARVGIVTQQTL